MINCFVFDIYSQKKYRYFETRETSIWDQKKENILENSLLNSFNIHIHQKPNVRKNRFLFLLQLYCLSNPREKLSLFCCVKLFYLTVNIYFYFLLLLLFLLLFHYNSPFIFFILF